MKSYPPLPEANLLTPVLLWEGPPIHNFMWRIALGLWGHPESEQSRRKQVHPGAVSLSDPPGESLSVRLAHSTISEPWAYVQCAVSILKFCLLVVLNQLQKPDPMLVGNPNLGTISLSRHRATSGALSIQVGKASTHPENVHTMTSW